MSEEYSKPKLRRKLLVIVVIVLMVGFVVFAVSTYHFFPSDSPGLPNPEHPMLYSPIKTIICDMPILIRALGLEVNDTYAVQYSKTNSFHHNWTAYGTEYNFGIKFEYKHKIGDYVFLYLYTDNRIVDTLSFQVEEVEG